MGRWRWLACAMWLGAVLPAAAQGLALAGIALGEPLGLPECPSRALYRGHMVYDDATAPCWRYPLVPQREGGGRLPADAQLELRALPLPPAFGKQPVQVTLVAGVVVQVAVRLPRRDGHGAALEVLRRQFGEPDALEQAGAIGTDGGSLSTLMATWRPAGGIVELTGATNAQGEGYLSATTREHAQRLLAPIDADD
jgi:hypothetical protein